MILHRVLRWRRNMASLALSHALEATGFLSEGEPAAGVSLGRDVQDGFRGRSLCPDAVWIGESRLTVYFKDVQDEPSDEQVAEWRREAWNHGFAPLLWVISPNHICLYNGFARPLNNNDDADANRLATFKRVESELDRLDAVAGRLAMETGAFWEQPLANAVDRSHRVDQQLLSDLAALERDLLHDGLPRPEAQALIGRSIFTQFLFDRKVLKLSGTLAGTLREPGAAHNLFDWLKRTFRSDMFPPESAVPQDMYLRRVADFLEAVDPKTGQTTLFPYQFDVIPVEVISSIYEQFARAASVAKESSPKAVKTGVFYTPVPLVSMVLDEVTQGISGKETVLDLTCGSAVFLVEALRRLVRIRTQDGGLTGKLVRSVLREQIYGVDISEAAVHVAAFSLYLAALELDPDLAALELDPYGEQAAALTFDPLIGRNLIVGDAWKDHEALKEGSELREFDLIVGNPPWSDPGKRARAERRRKRGESSIRVARGDSINFASRALEFAGPRTRVGLVLSANQFFSRSGSTPAQELVESLSSVSLVNLSNIQQWLFPNSRLPALVLFAGHRDVPHGTVTTVHVPWSPIGAKTGTIEVSPSDVLTVTRDACRRRPHILKAAFLGNRRDLALLDKLGIEHRQLDEELGRLELDTAVRSGVGGAGHGQRHAKALQGKPFLDNKAWKATAGGDKKLFWLPSRLDVFEKDTATRPRDPANYRAPLILIKETFSMSPRPLIYIADNDVVYSDAFHGIALPEEHAEAAAILAAILQSALAAWFLLMTSSSFGTWMRRIKVGDLNVLPVPDLVAARRGEQGHRLADMVRSLRRRKVVNEADREGLDEAVFDLYGLGDQERIVVRDGLVRAQWQWEDARAQSVRETSKEDLIQYASVFLGVVEDWLAAARKRHMRAEVLELPAQAPLRVVRFVLEDGFKQSPAPEVVAAKGNLREILDRLGRRLRVRLGTELYGQRELRVHGNAEVVVIKPNVHHRWMSACALEDADAVIVDSWKARKP